MSTSLSGRHADTFFPTSEMMAAADDAMNAPSAALYLLDCKSEAPAIPAVRLVAQRPEKIKLKKSTISIKKSIFVADRTSGCYGDAT